MNRLVSHDPTSFKANRQRIVEWTLWPVLTTLVCLAIFASARAGCGATDGRDWAVLGAAMVTGLATALTLWRPLRTWQALALSLVATVIVGGGLIVLGLLFWVHDCAN